MASKVCVLGGTGFVGSHLVPRLHEAGWQVTVLTRHPHRHRALQVLPGVTLRGADVHDPRQLAAAFAGQDAVINLVGILNESGRDTFQRVHVELGRKVVDACRQQGVPRLLHMSALNADPQAPSAYLRSKAAAEDYAHAAGGELAVTSFRPSVIFGPGDSFLNRFARLLRLTPFIFPLACPRARFQPVYVGDVARRMVDSLADPADHGRRIALCGPRVYTLEALVRYTAELAGLRRRIIGLPDWASRLQARLLGLLPGKPFTLDNYRSLSVDSVCGPDTRPCPTALEAVAPRYIGPHQREAVLQRFRRQARR